MVKRAYRVRNWKDYNKSLVKRGSISFWINEESILGWKNSEMPCKRGRPYKYSTAAIECGLTLKALLKLTFRSTEGFIRSLMELMHLDAEVPTYSLLCKRQRELSSVLPKKVRKGESLNILVDTTGIKIYGEGEWKVRQHGQDRRRVWMKLHLAVNEKSLEIEAFDLTDLGLQDCEGLPLLTEQIDARIVSLTGDGAYDRFSCYEIGEQRNFELITPPQKNSRTSSERPRNRKKASSNAVKKRDEVINEVRTLGRAEWKVKSNYHRRSRVETSVYRLKTLIGNRLSTRKFENQKIEMAIWCKIVNQITQLGMPVSYAVN